MSTLIENLTALRGVWREELSAVDENGVAVDHDPHGGVPGAFPYEVLVYIDFDGVRFAQTTVVLAGREQAVRTFEASVTGDVLEFVPLGPGAPRIVGVSQGPGALWFVADTVAAEAIQRYAEPDFIRIDGDRRWRHTVLWRNGALRRFLMVKGRRISNDTSTRHSLDPRGAVGPVHDLRSEVDIYAAKGSRP